MSASSTRPARFAPSSRSMSPGVTLNLSEKKVSGFVRAIFSVIRKGPILTAGAGRPQTFRTLHCSGSAQRLARLEGLDDLVDASQPVRQRGAGRQDVLARELVDLAGRDGGDRLPSGPRGDGADVHGLAAPGGQDDLRIARDDVGLGDDPLARGAALAQVGEDVAAAGDLDQVRDPADPGDERI